MEYDRRSNGILHGRMATTGLGGRPDVGDFGGLPGIAPSQRSIAMEMGSALSYHHANWIDGARKVALGVYLMNHVMRLCVVDFLRFLHLAVRGVDAIHPRRRNIVL